MNLYKVDKQKLIPIEPLDFKLERNIQNLIEANTRELFSLEFVSSEFTIGEFRLDSLCFDEESNSFVKFEKGNAIS